MFDEDIENWMRGKERGCLPYKIYFKRACTSACQPSRDESGLMSGIGVYIEEKPRPKYLREKSHASPSTANFREEQWSVYRVDLVQCTVQISAIEEDR